MSEDTLLQFMLASAEQGQQQRHDQQLPHSSGNSNWLLAHVSKYFDITTTDVVERILWSAIPVRKKRSDMDGNDELLAPLTDETISQLHVEKTEPYASSKQNQYSYMERFIQSRPDFYGPFWISSTLVFVVAILSNITSYVHYSSKFEETASQIPPGQTDLNESIKSMHNEQISARLDGWHYHMDELNMASSLIMTHLALVPTLFWCIFWFRGCSKYYTLSETICAYGYSLSIFIPLALVLTIQTILVRYFMITLTAALSGGVLLLSFLPVAQSDPNPASSHMILAMVPLFQFALAYLIHRIMLQ